MMVLMIKRAIMSRFLRLLHLHLHLLLLTYTTLFLLLLISLSSLPLLLLLLSFSSSSFFSSSPHSFPSLCLHFAPFCVPQFSTPLSSLPPPASTSPRHPFLFLLSILPSLHPHLPFCLLLLVLPLPLFWSTFSSFFSLFLTHFIPPSSSSFSLHC